PPHTWRIISRAASAAPAASFLPVIRAEPRPDPDLIFAASRCELGLRPTSSVLTQSAAQTWMHLDGTIPTTAANVVRTLSLTFSELSGLPFHDPVAAASHGFKFFAIENHKLSPVIGNQSCPL